MGEPLSDDQIARRHNAVVTEHPAHGFRARCACGWTGEDRHDRCRRADCDCFAVHSYATGHTRIEFDLEATDG